MSENRATDDGVRNAAPARGVRASSRWRAAFRAVLVLVVLTGLARCTTGDVNRPLSGSDPALAYRFGNLRNDPNDPHAGDETFIVLTFSGGGTRAAAFSFGVMQALRDTSIGSGRTMLDEVDAIASVSGGSFTAAYYGMFRESFFERFPQEVLKRPIETELLWRLLAPWNWPKLLSPFYGRGDLAGDYYSATIFAGQTFAGMPRSRPFIMINATDLGRGRQLSFVQDEFDLLCSDLNDVRVGNAVYASSAFPIAFTPMTLRNYNIDPACPSPAHEPSPMIDLSEADWVRASREIRDAMARPFIHLADGGLTDNLGVQAIEGGFVTPGKIDDVARRPLGLRRLIAGRHVKRLVLVVVDSRPAGGSGIDDTAAAPSLWKVLDLSVSSPMERVSANTLTDLRRQIQKWEQDEFDLMTRCGRRPQAPGCDGWQDSLLMNLDLHLVHLSLDLIDDDQTRRTLQAVGTRLELPGKRVDEIVFWGRKLALESQDFKNAVTAATRAVAAP